MGPEYIAALGESFSGIVCIGTRTHWSARTDHRASRGIGAAISVCLASEGCDVTLVARTTEDLRAVAPRYLTGRMYRSRPLWPIFP
ncbi:MAG: hypothetical protein Ct9H300mP8_06390 [Gammaproteobacteria bacterium]|nr:MAG: hypothetical protein Ct9H300mP8_06390 [Gammaproteobacteria bacterium]